ncbi:hypothetical protein J7373_16465 [Xanthomonas sp. A2111]|uniref:Uncharacterized protein n=2 Tax=Xanthomonas hawaiiensis TaxID=3003247 RepID=A0ABU2I5W8_9XANT|nr:hypothetical protein [Xanthomonas sp. A2111]MBO9829848.1 hypothetical protein [Xanthomonas sp. A2111]MDS9993538.1 hypothetical protein [Xanthomonas sp. A2111]
MAAYADQVAVRCHRCGAPGWVLAQWEPYRWQARFRCGQCAAGLDSANGDWAGAVQLVGRRACGHCGHQWVQVCVTSTMAVPPPKTVPARCAHCRKDSAVAVELRRLRDGSPCDPHFGMPLALVAPTRAGVLWAYNPRHLQELQDYVAATLRERRGLFGRSMVARLPAWMKLARHRPLMLRTLQRLQQASAQLPPVPAAT